MDDIVKEFIVESTENLDQMDRDLINLEKNPTSKELLDSIFRAIHTVKGTTGFLGYTRLESVAHAGESLLSRLREGALVLTPSITSGLLAMVDAVRTMLASIEKSGSDGDGDYAPLLETLTQLQAQRPDCKSHDSRIAPTPPFLAVEQGKLQDAMLMNIAEEYCDESVPLGRVLVEGGHVRKDQMAEALREQMHGDPRRLGEILVARGVVHPDEVLKRCWPRMKRIAQIFPATTFASM